MKLKYSFDKAEHIHFGNGIPMYGTSTVVGVLGKVLTYWASGLAVREFSGIEDSKIFTKIKNKKATVEEVKALHITVGKWLLEHPNPTTEEWVAICDKAYRAHSVKLDDSAQAGKDLHSALEHFVKNQMMGSFIDPNTQYDPRIQPFIDWTKENVDKFLFSEMHCYSEKNWVGGISDTGVLLKDGRTGIIDFKSAKEAYDSHFFQMGGYDMEISENGGFDENGVSIFKLEKPFDFYAVIPFGAKEIKPIFNDDLNLSLDSCRNAFLSCLVIHKIKEQAK